jgi:hypothetical protein
VREWFKKIDAFNYWLMSGLANANATAWTFYLLIFAVLKVWTINPPHSPLEWLNSVVQTLYQGSALPLLAFISKLQGDRQEKKIDETHEASIASRQQAAEERSLMIEILANIKKLLAQHGITEE